MMTSPPQANATITAVRGAGVADDWDTPGSNGAVKWQGRARAYYRKTTTSETGQGGATNIVTKRELIVTMDALRELGLDLDDRITFRVDDAEEDATATAQSVPRVFLPEIPAGLQTSRIRLENA
jgi:hypothetical protein